jgi:formylglycine-generating enzyme required for sulfatase activity
LANQSELLHKPSEEARRGIEARALLEETSKAPLHPTASQPLPGPGRVVIGQHSAVGVLFKKRYVVPIIAGVVLLGLIVLIPFIYSQRGSELPVDQPKPPTITNKTREMVLIEGGTFTMGSNSAGQEQRGEHTVSVPSFYIDKYEVTNADYAEFIKDTGRLAPTIDPTLKGSYWEPWNGNNPPPGRERWPVCNVSVSDAEAFADWLSKRDGIKYRLPREEEWEFAARNGSKDSLFPWGNSWEEGRANINQKGSPAEVGSFPLGATEKGVQDMIGNAWEWTATKAHFYDNAHVKASALNAHVQRGGSFAERMNTDFHNATDRSWLDKENSKFPTIGFRLARDQQ